MLFYPDDVLEKLEKLEFREVPPADSKEGFEQLAGELLNIDPDNGAARIMLAAGAELSGNLQEAERLAWEGLDRGPNDCQSYLTLSRILAGRDQNALSRRMFHLAIWKTAIVEEVDTPIKELCAVAEAAGETPDAYVRRNGNRLYRVLRRKGTGPVQ